MKLQAMRCAMGSPAQGLELALQEALVPDNSSFKPCSLRV